MVKFTIRPNVRVGDQADKEVTAPAYLLSPSQAISLGHDLIKAAREIQQEAKDLVRGQE